MPNSPIDPHLALRIEQLIDLLQQMLARDAHPLADRMDQFLEELSRIERNMSTAAEALKMAAPQVVGMVTKDDLALTEDRMAGLLEGISMRQARIERQLTTLFRPPGHEVDG